MALSQIPCAQVISTSEQKPAKTYKVKDSSGFGNDGPYIFYREEDMISKRIEKINNKYEIVVDTLLYNSRKIHINRDTEGANSFSLKVKSFHKRAKTEISHADSIFVISDLEGNFSALEQLLTSAKVVDKDFNWTFGKGHLVVLGDVFDRGLEVTQCLWLLYKLEQEAPKGQVHFVIGNHEALNFIGSINYVRNKYRLVSYALATDVPTMFSKQTVLGNWLRKKNMTLKIGDYLFAHGGISPFMVKNELKLKEINKLGRKYYDEEELNDKADLVFGIKGPMWYRGYFQDQKKEYAQITEAGLDSVLNYYDAKAIMVGHTIVETIEPQFNNKLFPVDVHHSENLKTKGKTEGLIIKEGRFYRHLTDGSRVKIH